MKARIAQKRTWTIWCTGMVVMILWVILLFWMRSIPKVITQGFFGDLLVHLRPAGFFPDELENNEPVNLRRSRLESWLDRLSFTTELGFWDRHKEIFSPNPKSKTWRYEGSNRTAERVQLIFDRKRGVWKQVHVTQDMDKNRSWTRADAWYAGPKGMSRQYASDLGRFQQDRSVCYFPAPERGVIIFYDGKLRQLFRLDFETQTVTAGTILPREKRIVQMGPTLRKNSKLINGPRLIRPQKLISAAEVNDYDPQDVFVESGRRDENPRYAVWLGGDVRLGATLYPPLVLTSAGEIYEMDPQTARLRGVLDHMPKLGARGTIDDLLAYTVLPVTVDRRFAGIVMAAASRDAKRVHLRAIPLGKETKVATSRSKLPVNPLVLSPFLIMRAGETLHPLGLSVLSRWLAPKVEALAGYRALFILPNSSAIQEHLDPHNDPLAKEIGFFLGIAPQLILGILLGLRLRRETRYRGLKSSICEGWFLAAIIIGVPAYITYHLTRSRVALITCKNCGQARRCDGEHCHHCQSAWENPAIQAPTWRVLEST